MHNSSTRNALYASFHTYTCRNPSESANLCVTIETRNFMVPMCIQTPIRLETLYEVNISIPASVEKANPLVDRYLQTHSTRRQLDRSWVGDELSTSGGFSSFCEVWAPHS